MQTIQRLSVQQQAVLDWADSGEGHLILLARAGTGKSSTLLALVEHIVGQGGGNIFVGAYNRAIANEFTARLAAAGIDWKGAVASTMHGAGFQAWRKIAPSACANVDDKKVRNLIDTTLLNMRTWTEQNRLEASKEAIIKAISMAKQQALGVIDYIDDYQVWGEIYDYYGIDLDLPEGESLEYAVEQSIRFYTLSLDNCRECIDFDDMILAPLFYNARFWQNDWVLIDECQDTNPARRELAKRLLKPEGRAVYVGDAAQAIYGFTGASSDSMDIIQREMKAKVLPLNVSFRCPKLIVERARQWVPDFEAHEDNPLGTIRQLDYSKLTREQFQPTDAILCRNTKPLVELAYNLLRVGVACKVEGREIGTGLIKLITRWKVDSIEGMLDKLDEWQSKETAKFRAKGKDDRIAEVVDRCETIRVLAECVARQGKHSLPDLVDFVKSLFGDTKPGERPKCLTLATVHKAKGREWPRVYILGQAKYMPSPWAKKPWQQVQERNLLYVATTRAMRELVDVVVNNEEGL